MLRAHVERAAEDEGEAEHVVDLVRIVGAAGRDDGVGAHAADRLGRDLRVGVRHREDDRLVRHALDHLGRDHAGLREPDEDVGAAQRVRERARVGLARERLLVAVHALGAADVDHAAAVAQDDVLGGHAEVAIQPRAGDARGARAVEHDLHVVERAAGELQRVEQRRARDDRRAVLIVVEDGDVEALDQAPLDLEALGRADVLEVDPAEGRRDQLDHAHDLVHVLAVDLDVEDVDVGEALEEDRLALHHGLGGAGAEVAEAEHRGAVGDDGDEVAARGVLVDLVRVARDLAAGLGDPRGVGEREVFLGPGGLGRGDLELSGPALRVIGQRLLSSDQGLLRRRALRRGIRWS